MAHAKGRFDSQEAETALAGPRVDWPWSPATKPSRAGQAAAAVQHHGAHERRLRRRRLAGAGHARRRVAVPRRPHQLPAYRQHGVPALLDLHGSGGHSRGFRRWRPAARLAAQAKFTPTRGKKRTTDHPPIYPVGAPRRGSAATRPRSTTLSRAASWPRCCPRRDRAPAARRAHRRGAVPGAWQPGRRAGLPRGLREVHGQARSPAASVGRRRRAHGAGLRLETKRRSRRAATARARSSRRWRTSAWAPRPRAPTSSSTSTTATTCATTPWSPPSSAWRSSRRSTPGHGYARRHHLHGDDRRAGGRDGPHQRGRPASAPREPADSAGRGRRRRREPGDAGEGLEAPGRRHEDIRDRSRRARRPDARRLRNCGGQILVSKKTGKRFAACVGKQGEAPAPPEGETARPARLRADVPAAAVRPSAHRQGLRGCGGPRSGSSARAAPVSSASTSTVPQRNQARTKAARGAPQPEGVLSAADRPVPARSSPSRASTAAARPPRRPAASARCGAAAGRHAGAPGARYASRAARRWRGRPARPAAPPSRRRPGPRRSSTRPPRPARHDVLSRQLAAGCVVLDRFLDSSLAYQGCARGLGVDEVLRSTCSPRRPAAGRHLVLAVDPVVGLAAPAAPDRIEAEGVELQQRVAEGYERSRRSRSASWSWTARAVELVAADVERPRWRPWPRRCLGG